MIGSGNSRWLAFHRSNPAAAIRLFCFPYAGGGAILFRSWSSQLPGNVEVCPVELPGRGQRRMELPFDEISSLVDSVAAGLRPYLGMPFAFFGHSLGALIGFELARYLRRERGPSPVHLFVSGCRAPQLPADVGRFHTLTDEQFVSELERLNGTPRGVLADAELMQIVLPVLRADFKICECYAFVAEAPLGIPISAFGGIGDTMVQRVHLEPWRELTTSEFKLHMLPGDHFFLTGAEPMLLRAIGRQLQNAPSLADVEHNRA